MTSIKKYWKLMTKWISNLWKKILELFQGKDKKVKLKYVPSPSDDVKYYKLYVENEPITPTYESKSYDIGKSGVVNIENLLGKGSYNLGLVAVDKAGNESNFSAYVSIKI